LTCEGIVGAERRGGDAVVIDGDVGVWLSG